MSSVPASRHPGAHEEVKVGAAAAATTRGTSRRVGSWNCWVTVLCRRKKKEEGEGGVHRAREEGRVGASERRGALSRKQRKDSDGGQEY